MVKHLLSWLERILEFLLEKMVSSKNDRGDVQSQEAESSRCLILQGRNPSRGSCVILGKLLYLSEARLLLCYMREVRVEYLPPGALVGIKRGHRGQAAGTVFI